MNDLENECLDNERFGKMEILQKIKIDGRNWNDIIGLPCIAGLMKAPDGKGGMTFRVYLLLHWHVNSGIYADGLLKAIGGHVIDSMEKLNEAVGIGMLLQGQCEAEVGDTLVEYENHKWSVEAGR